MPEAVCGDHLRALAARVTELQLRRDQLISAVDEAPPDPYAAVDIDAARHAILRIFESGAADAAKRTALVRTLIHEIRIESPEAIYPRFRLPVPPGATGDPTGRTQTPRARHHSARDRGSYSVKIGTPGLTPHEPLPLAEGPTISLL